MRAPYRPAHENGVSPGLQYSPRGRGNDWATVSAAAASQAAPQWITDHNGTPIVWTPGGQHAAHNPHHVPPPPVSAHDHRFAQNRHVNVRLKPWFAKFA